MAPALDHVDDEMHELNQEADYLDQTVTVDGSGVNGHKKSEPRKESNDPDAQAQVIDSLRAQVQDLFSQVSQLNTKLVRSYDRVSDLEDELHVTSDNLRSATLKVSQLELERAQHMSALSTGLLVERSHVTTELTRLMEKATEEAARAGEAVSAKAEIEKELDDLSAGLFDQANRMVAEARLARARSERKVEETEEALRGAEEIVGMLQTQLQALQAEKEASDRKVEEMNALIGKGKWVERPQPASRIAKVRLMCLHAPYLEYIQFIAHLRSIRPSSSHPPAMSTLLPLPFLARLVAEDSDPTVRLDLAPQLNWLTRRSVISAIHAGQLSIEPMSTSTLLEELAQATPGSTHHSHVSCAMCGAAIIDSPASPTRSSFSPTSAVKSSWTPTLLKSSLVQTITSASFGHSRPATPTTSSAEPPAHVFIFRLEATSSSGLPVSLPMGNNQPGTPRPPTIYPLCTSGWCLTRLRTTCSLWAFVRTNVVEKVWEEELSVPTIELNTPRAHGSDSDLAANADKAPLTPKRSRMGIGALWGSMSRSLSNTTTPKSDTEAESPKAKEDASKADSKPPIPPRRLPPPPPRHPPLAAPVPRAPAGPPPPLPKRNRQRTASPSRSETPAAPTPPPRDADTPSEAHPALLSPPDEVERFTTPVEELGTPASERPTSPSAVPLPASAPATPVHTTMALPEQSDPVAGIATPPALHAEDEKPPVPPRAQPPPPLPRRAAARARPVPPPPGQEGAPASADAPVGESGLVEGAGGQKAEASDAAPVSEDEVKEEQPEAAAHESANAPASKSHEDEKPSESVEDQLAVEEEASTINAHEHEEAKELPSAPASVVNDEHLDVVVSSKEGSLRSLDEVPLANDSDAAPEELAGESTPETASDVAASDDEPGVYVGNSTWEERTWKELVKLREEMFWARLGGIR